MDKRYKVRLTRTVEEQAEIEVAAKSVSDAERSAIDMLGGSGESYWHPYATISDERALYVEELG